MKRTQNEVAELEAELLRLNNLVRQRRLQLARLESCPHKDCECRQVWHDVVEKKLASQVGKIRKKVRERPAKGSTKKSLSRPKSAKSRTR